MSNTCIMFQGVLEFSPDLSFCLERSTKFRKPLRHLVMFCSKISQWVETQHFPQASCSVLFVVFTTGKYFVLYSECLNLPCHHSVLFYLPRLQRRVFCLSSNSTFYLQKTNLNGLMSQKCQHFSLESGESESAFAVYFKPLYWMA